MNLGSILHGYGLLVAGTVVLMVGVLAARLWKDYAWWWGCAVALAFLAALAFLYPFPSLGELDERLPWLFIEYFRGWIFGLGAIALLSLLAIKESWSRFRSGGLTGSGGAEDFADIQVAWDTILRTLNKADIDPASRDLFLLLGHDESLAASLIDASGLDVLVPRTPALESEPIHAVAVADALFLSCLGEPSSNAPGGDREARLTYLCRRIAELSPERPILRGVALLIPFDWAYGPDTNRRGPAISRDLELIRRILRVRCPTLTICCLPESIPGASEFATRMATDERNGRAGFVLPASRAGDSSTIPVGMDWMTRYIRYWLLNLMYEEIEATNSNGDLLSLIEAFKARRRYLANLLDSGLSVQPTKEPNLHSGCYFVFGGPSYKDRALAAGLFRKKGRLMEDRKLTAWSGEAVLEDRRYRRWAYYLAASFITISGVIWLVLIIPRFAEVKLAAVGAVGLAGVAISWLVALFDWKGRRKATT